jgi:transcriptional regulator with XRE-family HTH domain
MKPNIENHPAVRLGRFIREQRLRSGFTLREAAIEVGLRPSEFAELEHGIGDHLSEQIFDNISSIFRVDDETFIFENLVEETQNSDILEFSDVFEKEEILPLLRPLTEEQRKQWFEFFGFETRHEPR